MCTLEKLNNICSEYIKNPIFVYKKCNNRLNDSKDTYKERDWLIVMKKLEITKTNESRLDVLDERYAKFRADKCEVIKIINIHTLATTAYVINKYDCIETKYEVGKIVEAHEFDNDKEKVCSSGIHYFKSLEAAYFYELLIKQDGILIKWHDNGQKGAEGKYLNRMKSGKWESWYDNGQLESSGKYENGVQIGEWTNWHDNGNFSLDGKYEEGKKIGKWKRWFDNGIIKSEEEYLKGELSGVSMTWFYSGTKSSEGSYLNGKKTGRWTILFPNSMKVEKEYLNGKLSGKVKLYYDNNIMKEKGEYLNGHKEGRWTSWYRDYRRIKKCEGEYKNGKKTGLWIKWDINGNETVKTDYSVEKCLDENEKNTQVGRKIINYIKRSSRWNPYE